MSPQSLISKKYILRPPKIFDTHERDYKLILEIRREKFISSESSTSEIVDLISAMGHQTLKLTKESED